jgi:integrase
MFKSSAISSVEYDSAAEHNLSFKVMLILQPLGYFRFILVIADYTAMRKGEVLNLKWADVDLEAGKIYVQESKNGEKREVPVHDELKKILEANRNGKSEYVVNENGRTIDSIDKGFRAAREKAGLGDFHIHDLRHRAITRWIKAGFPPNVIMKATGHKTYSAFNRYANLKGDDVMVLVGKKSKELPLITYQDLQAIA